MKYIFYLPDGKTSVYCTILGLFVWSERSFKCMNGNNTTNSYFAILQRYNTKRSVRLHFAFM